MQRGGTALAGVRLVAVGIEGVDQQGQLAGLFHHHQHAFGGAIQILFQRGVGIGGQRFQRNVEIETGTAARRAVHPHHAAMAAHDALARHQAQAGAGFLGGEERLEQMLQHGIVHARAAVDHADAQVAARMRLFAGHEKIDGQFGLAGFDAQPAAVGHRLDGVEAEIEQALLQLGVVALERQLGVLDRQLHRHRAGHAALHQQVQRAEQFAQPHLFGAACAAGERQHRLHHVQAALAAIAHELAQPRQARVVLVILQAVAGQQQRLQQVAQVVAEAAGEHRQALETLRADQVGLGAAVGLARVRLDQRATHRAGQAHRILLQDVVGGAVAQRLDRGLLTQGRGDEDERQVFVVLAQQFERALPGEAGHAEVGQHDMRMELVQCGEVAGLVINQPRFVRDTVGVQFGQHQLGIELAVLHLQHPYRRHRLDLTVGHGVLHHWPCGRRCRRRGRPPGRIHSSINPRRAPRSAPPRTAPACARPRRTGPRPPA